MRRRNLQTGKGNKGLIQLEMLAALPVLFILAFGSAELGRYAVLNQKLQNAAAALSDLTAREKDLTSAELNGIFNAVRSIVDPFQMNANGVAIVSGVGLNSSGQRVILWQRRGAGTLGVNSAIGTQGSLATLPASMTLQTGDTLIVSELIYDFTPIFGDYLQNRRIAKIAYFRPRLGSLQNIL